MPVIASSLSPAVSFHRSYDEISTVHNNAFEHTVLYIEELRLQLYSCFTCGVSWLQDQVCLDCRECGGYALQRPCVQCDGRCQAQWTRDLSMTHACGKARWSGTCELSNVDGVPSTLPVKEDQERVSNSSTNLKL